MTTLTAAPRRRRSRRPAVDVRCLCAGYLLWTADGTLTHVDTCQELHPPGTPCPDDRTTHRTCSTPRPVLCGHPHRRPTPATLNAPDCRGGLAGCCGCCHETGPS